MKPRIVVWFRRDFIEIEVSHDVRFSMPYSELPPDLIDNKTLQRLRDESHAFHFHQDDQSHLLVKGSEPRFVFEPFDNQGYAGI
jgi:hypothetical protein